nr:helix-turn-helix domain-containing protein [Fredinandcohnia onubensis]
MKPSIELIKFSPGCPFSFKVNSKNNYFHKHAGLEIIWVIDGKIKITVNKINYFLERNDLMLINHFESHQIQTENKNANILHFNIDSLFLYSQNPQFYDLLFDVKSFKNSKENQQPFDVIRSLLSYMCLADRKTSNIQTSFLKLVDYLTSRFSNKISLTINQERLVGEGSIIKNILNKVETDFKGKMTLNDIAHEQHYNSSYLSDLFKKNVGITFKSYLDETRLRYSLNLLLQWDMSITEVSLLSGFSDDKSFYKVFKRKFSKTPLQFREQYKNKSVWENAFDGVDAILSSNLLQYYLSIPIKESVIEHKISEESIEVDVNNNGAELKRVWNKIVNIGSASSLLIQNVQDQLRDMQADIKFEFVRFEGIFNQEMEVLQIEEGGFKYNWKFVNNILDYLVGINTKPFISLSYMPQLLACSDANVFNYRSNTSPPKEMSQWLSLVQSFLMNCINHFGYKEVSKWYFQVWTEFPYNRSHWNGTFHEYLEFYKQTALLIKGLSKNFKVGPASENYYSEGNLLSEKLLEYCKKHNVPIDFYACNIYHNQIINLDKINANFIDYKGILFQYEGQNYTKQRIEKSQKLLRNHFNEDTEYIITRWNFSWDVHNYLHDTAFMSTFIIENMLHSSSSLTSAIGFLSASDILYEWSINNHPFYGGSGLVNTEGVKKAAYYAFVLLEKLGSEVIKKGSNYIVTKNGEEIQILVYNHAYPNQIYCQGDDQLKDPYQRYDCFEEKNSLQVNVELNNIYGTYRCRRYQLNRDHGSAFDDWVRLGGVIDMGQEEISYLKRKSYPNLNVNQIICEGSYQISVQVPVHGLECIVFQKVFH